MNPEQLRKIWADAHRLLSEFGWKQDKVNKYIHEQTGLEDLSALVAKAFPPEETPPEEKPGKAGTFATHAGNMAAMGMSDEIAGALDAMQSQPTVTRQGFQSTPIPGMAEQLQGQYVQGRDESRDYLEAGREANPGTALLGDLTGAVAGGSLLPVGRVAAGTDLLPAMLKGAAAGAGIGAVTGVGTAGDRDVRGEIMPTGDVLAEGAKGAAIGAPLGAGGALLGRTMQTTANPAAARGEEIMGAESGLSSATAAISGSASDVGEANVVRTLESLRVPGTPEPLLAEGGPVLRTEATKFVARSNPKAREMAISRVKQVLAEATKAKQEAQKAYEPLEAVPVMTRGVGNIVRKYGKVMGQDWLAAVTKRMDNGHPPTFRQVNDLRMELSERAQQGFKRFAQGQARSKRVTRVTDEAADFLYQALRADVPGFEEAQATVKPFIMRELGLKQLRAELSQGRGRVMPSPGAGAPGHAAKELFIGATWARNARASQQLVDVLFTPRPPDAQIAALHKLRHTFPLMFKGTDPLAGGVTAGLMAEERKD